VKLKTASMKTLQHGATDLLATSSYYKGNILLAGKAPRPSGPAARLVTPSESPVEDTTSTNNQLEGIIKCLWSGFSLNHPHTSWLKNKYKCILCFSNSHPFEECRAASRKWTITPIAPRSGPARGGRTPNGRLAGASPSVADEQAPRPPPQPHPSAIPGPTNPDPKANIATYTAATGEDKASKADKSDDAFTYFGHDSDPDLLCALTQVAARQATHAQRVRFIDGGATPTRTIAKVSSNECHWVDSRETIPHLN
jgi:hypothetical protein